MELIKRIVSYNLIKNSAIYALADGFNRAIPFLILPVIVRYLTPEDYGIITNYIVLTQVIVVFVYGAAQGAIPVLFFKLSRNEYQDFIISFFSIAYTISFFFLFILVCFRSFFEHILNIEFRYLLLSIVEVLMSSFICINLLMWRCKEKPTAFGVFQMIQTISSVILTLLFVVLLNMAWEGKILANFLIILLMGLLSSIYLYKKKYYRLSISFKYSRMVLAFALPLIPHSLALWGKSGIDKILLTNLSGLTENGLYSTALTWGAIITIINTSFSNAFSPYLYKRLSSFENNSDKRVVFESKLKLVKLSYLFVVFLALIVFFSYFIFYWLIIIIYPENYYGATKYLSWILIGEFFRGWYMIYICYIHYTLNTKVLGVITFSLSLFQIALSYYLIIYYGAIGAAISTCLISLLTTIGVGIYSNKVYPMPWFFNSLKYE